MRDTATLSWLACSDDGETIVVFQAGGSAGVAGMDGGGSGGKIAGSGGVAVAGAGGRGDNAGGSGDTGSGSSGGTAGGSDGGASGGAGGSAGGSSDAGSAGSAAGSGGSSAGGPGKGSCQGTAALCETLDAAQCAAQTGCDYLHNCQGEAQECNDFNLAGETWCNQEPNCTWNSSANRCDGPRPPDCGDRDLALCETAGSGCNVVERCFDFPLECSSFLLETSCSNHLGCVWQ